MRLAVRFGGRRGHCKTARVVVLDHGDGDLRGEIPHGAPCGVGIDVVVVAHRLAAQLLRVREPACIERVEVQRGVLMRVLAVPQHMRTVPRPRVGLRELLELRLLHGVGALAVVFD